MGLALPSVCSGADGPLLADELGAIAATGVQLIYSSDTVPSTLRVRHAPQGASTAERLRSLLAPLGLEARPLPSGGFAIVAASPPPTAKVTVRVSSEGETPPAAIAAAVALIPQAHRRARTDRNGRATFAELPPGNYDLEVRAEGFKTGRRQLRVEPADVAAVDVSLVPDPTPVEQVTVESSRYDATATVGVPITRDGLQSTPVTSNDAARSLQVLPGTAVAGYTARTHIRGSRDDETLFRYDGLTLTDPYHLNDLQSLLSAIDPATVAAVTSWTGIAPIDFGGRIGGVVDIEPRLITGPAVDAQTSQRDASVLLGTTFGDGRGSIFAALRLGNTLSPIGWIDHEMGPPAFDDLVIRATWTLGARTSVAAGILAIDDRRAAFSIGRSEDTRVSGRDLYSWLRLAHELAPTVRSETLLSTEDFRDRASGVVNEPGIESGTLSKQDDHSSFTVREELTYSPSTRWSVRAGGERTAASVHHQLASVAGFFAPFVPGLQPNASVSLLESVDVRAAAAAAYVNIRWQATDGTIADFGLRRDSRWFTSAAGDSQSSLRANVRQRLSEYTTLRVGWGQASQADLYALTGAADGSPRPAAPRRLTQSNISLEHALPNGLSLRAEAYAKRERSPLETYENVFSEFALVPELEVDYRPVRAQAAQMRGIEVTVESDQSRPVNGWLSYAWSRADDLVAGQWSPRSWDQPRALQVGTRWQRGAWRAGGVLSWHTGWPYTPLVASSTQWIDPQRVTLALASRNSARLQSVVSLDLRVSWERPLWNGTFETFLELYDATDSQAVCCRNFSIMTAPDGSSRLVDSPGVWLSFTPVLGARWRH